MKRFAIVVFVAVAVLGAVNSANASIWIDQDPLNVTLSQTGSLHSVDGVFDIVTLDNNYAGDVAGFNPGTDLVTKAVVTVKARDDNDWQWEEMSVTLDSTDVGSQFFFNIPFSDNLSAELIGSINTDGILNYSITATSGDFVVEYAKLRAEGVAGGAVPEPATLVIWSLLGMGSCLGMRVWRRRGAGLVETRQSWSPENRAAIRNIIARSR
jgi:hypothetical protein